MMFYRQVYQIVRRHLELAAGLLADIGTSYWKTATFYPEDEAQRELYKRRDPLRLSLLVPRLVRSDG